MVFDEAAGVAYESYNAELIRAFLILVHYTDLDLSAYDTPEGRYAAQDAVAAPRSEKPEKARKVAKKRSDMTVGEQLRDSFTKTATTSAGRQLGSSLTRSLLGVLGLNGGKKR